MSHTSPPPRTAASGTPSDTTASRIDWLFREALRRNHIHPLMEALRRYRDRSAA